MTALVCGSRSSEANVAPPLKSTRTKLSASDECVTASAEHQRAQQLALAGAGGADEQAVRAHAVLRRLLEVQLDRRRRRRRRRSAPAAGPGSGAAPSPASTSSASGRRCRAGRPGPCSAVERRVGAAAGARTAAAARAAGPAPRPRRRVEPVGRARRSVAPSIVVRVQPRRPASTSSTSSRRGRAAAAAGWSRSMTVTPSTPPSASEVRRRRPGRRRRARRRRAGRRRPGAGRVEPRPVGEHVVEQSPPARPTAARPAGPGRARRLPVGCRACGSHLTHSHSAAPLRRRRRPRCSRSSGAWKAASWASIARTRPRVAVGRARRAAYDPGEAAQRRPRPAGRARPSTRRRTGAARRRVIGSRSSSGWVSGGISGVASVCGPDRRPGPRRSRRRPGAAPTAGGCPRSTTARPGRGAGRTAPSRCSAAVSRTRAAQARPGAACTRGGPAIISALLRRPGGAAPARWRACRAMETPNMPPTT